VHVHVGKMVSSEKRKNPMSLGADINMRSKPFTAPEPPSCWPVTTPAKFLVIVTVRKCLEEGEEEDPSIFSF
jgi:hypothetical protein